MYISKSDFLTYLKCPKYFWLCKKKPEVCNALELSAFAKQLIEQGNEVEKWARKLFPHGVMVETKREQAVLDTKQLLKEGHKTIFQATFMAEDLYVMVDVLTWDEVNQYWVINEVKGSSSQQDGITGKKKDEHLQDATFQKIVLAKAGYRVGRVNLIELNKEFRKDGDIIASLLLVTSDITEKVGELESDVLIQIDDAKRTLEKEEEPRVCNCIYKPRKDHCPSFAYSHPDVPDYSVHDICRIGVGGKRLPEIIENGWMKIEDIPLDYKMSPTQTNQVYTTITGEVIIKESEILKDLEKLKYPLYFLDYETFPTAIPVFDGCYPYQQVPFQYSLHVLESPDSELQHFEFLQMDFLNPMTDIAQSLREKIGDTGSVIVWNKKFEKKCNEDLAEANPHLSEFFITVNNRLYDLMEIFSKQMYVHKAFKGSASIKYVLPVMVPGFSYSELNIQDGGMALTGWKEMFDSSRKDQISQDLLDYCELDTLAMVKILEAIKKT